MNQWFFKLQIQLQLQKTKQGKSYQTKQKVQNMSSIAWIIKRNLRKVKNLRPNNYNFFQERTQGNQQQMQDNSNKQIKL